MRSLSFAIAGLSILNLGVLDLGVLGFSVLVVGLWLRCLGSGLAAALLLDPVLRHLGACSGLGAGGTLGDFSFDSQNCIWALTLPRGG